MRQLADAETLAATHVDFIATDAAWSDALAAHYGKPGSNGYDRGRYRTAHHEWPQAVRDAYGARAVAYHAWAKARDLVGDYVHAPMERAAG